MKRICLLLSAALLLTLSSCEVLNSGAVGNVLKDINLGNPSSTEISQALKQALEIGTNQGAERLSAKDGFLGNLAVKILFPPEAQKVESTLRSLGLNSLVDNIILSLNRAAENAAAEAKPIFVSAIRQMTIADATSILLGQENAATLYFKRTTSAELMKKFKPVVAQSLQEVNATKYWSDAIGQYNRIPMVKSIDTDLSQYVAQKAIDGLFLEIAKEELKIRDNFSARNSVLLQKVFGYADRMK